MTLDSLIIGIVGLVLTSFGALIMLLTERVSEEDIHHLSGTHYDKNPYLHAELRRRWKNASLSVFLVVTGAGIQVLALLLEIF